MLRLPALMFDAEDEVDEADPLRGYFHRATDRGGALALYLLMNVDLQTGEVRKPRREWSHPTEHGRDARTIALALHELLGHDPECVMVAEGGHIRPHHECDGSCGWPALFEATEAGGLRVVDEFLRLWALCFDGELPWTALSSAVVRGGPWCVFPDATRVLWAFFRVWCPQEARSGAVDPFYWPAVELARRSGRSVDTVLGAAQHLQTAGLLLVWRELFSVNGYLAPRQPTIRVARTDLDTGQNLEPQVRHLMTRGRKGTARERLAGWWWTWWRRHFRWTEWLGREQPGKLRRKQPPKRLRLALGQV